MGSSNFLTINKISKKDRDAIKYLLENYTVEELVSEGKLGKKILPYIGAGLLAMSSCNFNPITQSDKENIEVVDEDGLTEEEIEFLEEQIVAASKYIDANLRRNGKTIEDIPFDITDLVLSCYENSFDLPLAMAQLQIESHFGTDGRRQNNTKSLFSVGLYDSGKNVKHYATYKDAIDDYVKLMKKHYLQDGKVSVDQLLTNFVDDNNHRYASDKNYEKSVKSTRNKIIKDYPILLGSI